MARLREFLQKNPAAGYAIAVLLIALAGYLMVTRILGATRGPAPTPPAAQQPAGPQAPTPAPPAPPAAQPTPPATQSAKVVPPGPSGRSDPFVPLVRPPQGAAQAPRPTTPLPPPPFPVPGTPLPPPPFPGPTPQPAPAPAPPPPSAGVSVLGMVVDSPGVVVVQVGGRTEILFEGESAGDLKVVKIDAARRLVTFERAGKRFDVAMGGV